MYIFDKNQKKILEYEGSLKTKELREVRLAPGDDTNIEVKQGKWEKLSSANFKELYPIINDDEENPNPPDFIKTKTASIKALKDIKSQT